jgi:hypothetical protein
MNTSHMTQKNRAKELTRLNRDITATVERVADMVAYQNLYPRVMQLPWFGAGLREERLTLRRLRHRQQRLLADRPGPFFGSLEDLSIMLNVPPQYIATQIKNGNLQVEDDEEDPLFIDSDDLKSFACRLSIHNV